MRVLIIIIIVLIFNSFSFAQNEFITTWRTSSANESITIPTKSGLTYNYDVNWGDGSSTSGHTGDASHVYSVAGDYQVKITGVFPRIYFNNGGDKNKIISIDQWGNQAWTSMNGAFYGCSNLAGQASDSPDLSGVSTLAFMFAFCSSFNQNIGNWTVDNIVNMSWMFYSAGSFNQDIGNWHTGNVTDMSYMFYGASSFNQDISNWDVSKVITMSNMFNSAGSFNRDIGSWQTVKVSIMSNMFSFAGSFNQDIGNWDVSKVTNMKNMFSNASSFNQDISNWNVSNVTNMKSMFWHSDVFNQDLSSWDFGKVTDMSQMFQNVISFNQNLGNWNLNSNVNLSYMLDQSGMDVTNYDSTLIGWEALGISGRSLGAAGLSYCNGQTARNSLINTYGWTIMGDVHNCAIPLTIIDFKAELTNNEEIKLTSIMESSVNIEYIIIQKSNNAIKWEQLLKTKAIFNKSGFIYFDELDPFPFNGVNYYRLAIINQDGENSFSKIISVNKITKDKTIQIVPNPSSDYFRVENAEGEKITILNNFGEILKIHDKYNGSDIDISNYPAGIYIIKIKSNSKETTKKILINN